MNQQLETCGNPHPIYFGLTCTRPLGHEGQCGGQPSWALVTLEWRNTSGTALDPRTQPAGLREAYER